jgi:type IV secretory pathway TrbD component
MTGMIREANPLMAWVLSIGLETFYLIRFGIIFLLAAIAEWYMKYNPLFVKRVMHIGIAVYIGLYIISFVSVNT